MNIDQCFGSLTDRLLIWEDMVFPSLVYRYSNEGKHGHVYVWPIDTINSLNLPDGAELVVEDPMIKDGMIVWKDELEMVSPLKTFNE